ncbi:MAG: ComF family protein [Phycisphaeraceae bacterium]
MPSVIAFMLNTLAPPEVNTTGWLPDTSEAYCPSCGVCVGPGEVLDRHCSRCRSLKLPWSSMTRLGRYKPPLSDWIKRLKYHGRHSWADELGVTLADALPPHLDPCVVVPVPMHWLRRTTRGLDHTHLIARAIARRQRWTFSPLLRRSRLTAPQSLIPPSQRVANLRGSIEPRKPRWIARDIPERVLLVDDIKTTGATLTRCARCLQRLGVREVHTAVLAVAEPH